MSLEKDRPYKRSPKASPERLAARQAEKDNSPVREFLNQDASDDDADFDLDDKSHDDVRKASLRERLKGQKPSGIESEQRLQMDKIECHEPLDSHDSDDDAVGPLS